MQLKKNFMKSLEKFPDKFNLATFADLVILIYQKTISPDHGVLQFLWGSSRCRFYPSCSEYTRRAIRQYGLFAGGMVSVKRIMRCNPAHRGGYDPVT